MRLLATMLAATAAASPAAAAPLLSQAAVSPSTWTRTGPVTVAWSQDLMEASGVTSVRVQVNGAPTGTPDGPWATVWTDPTPGLSGPRTAVVDLPAGDGAHLVRVVAAGIAGPLASVAAGTIRVDETPPAVTPRGASHTPLGSTVTWDEEDATSGLARPSGPDVALVNVSPAGDAAGAWIPVEVGPGAGGGAAVHVAAALAGPGRHLVRREVRDAAGNTATATVGVAFSDARPPVVDALVTAFPTPGAPLARVVVSARDEANGSGVDPAAVADVTDDATGLSLWRGALGPSGQVAALVPLPGPRAYRLVAAVRDRSGNVGTSPAVLVTSPGGSPVGAPAVGAGSPGARPATPVLRVLLRGGRGAAGGRRVTFGESLTLAARVTAASGRALPGARVVVRDAAGTVLATGRAGAAGVLTVRVRPRAGGPLRATVTPRGGVAAPAAVRGPHRVRVVPRVAVRITPAAVVAGGAPVVAEGRIAPAPRDLPGEPRKRVTLEWRDPLRGEWRPVRDGQAGPDGRFRLPWRFGAGGFAVPMRVRVPEEVGWPLDPLVTRPVLVTVGE